MGKIKEIIFVLTMAVIFSTGLVSGWVVDKNIFHHQS